jgi:DNA-binding transcriptional ArsR family regulator
MEQHRLDVFQVIADPSRRQILNLLSKDSLTINSLAENSMVLKNYKHG